MVRATTPLYDPVIGSEEASDGRVFATEKSPSANRRGRAVQSGLAIMPCIRAKLGLANRHCCSSERRPTAFHQPARPDEERMTVNRRAVPTPIGFASFYFCLHERGPPATPFHTSCEDAQYQSARPPERRDQAAQRCCRHLPQHSGREAAQGRHDARRCAAARTE